MNKKFMLIGLLSKNAILIVEYALQRRQKGMSITKAAISGALARLRPILMTSFAMAHYPVPSDGSWHPSRR